MCSQYDHVTFYDKDGAFRLSKGFVNDALPLGDGLHPNYKGTQKLINTLDAIVHCYKNQFLIRITGTQMATTVLQVVHHFFPSLLSQNNRKVTNQPFHVISLCFYQQNVVFHKAPFLGHFFLLYLSMIFQSTSNLAISMLMIQ